MSKELSSMELEVLTNIGRNVKFIRRDLLDVKIMDISEKTGVSRDVICRLEALSSGSGKMGNGRVYPSISTVIKFCEGVGICAGDLLDNDIMNSPDIQTKILNHCKGFVNLTKGVKIL